MIQWGPHEKNLERQRAKGRQIGILDEKPDVPDDLRAVWEVFLRLSQARGSSGFGSCSLTIADILAALTIHGITKDPELTEEYLVLITSMDAEYMKLAAEKQDRDNKKREKK